MNPFDTYDGAPLKARFYDGLKLYRNMDYQRAVLIFREIDAAVGANDSNQNKYKSYLGLTLINLGDATGISECRQAAAGERHDTEVHYNLAIAELKLENRKRAVAALQRGLAISPSNPDLLRLRSIIGVRRPPPLPFLSRDNFLNVWLGRLTYRRQSLHAGAGKRK